jgi:hypothetical protein
MPDRFITWLDRLLPWQQIFLFCAFFIGITWLVSW